MSLQCENCGVSGCLELVGKSFSEKEYICENCGYHNVRRKGLVSLALWPFKIFKRVVMLALVAVWFS